MTLLDDPRVEDITITKAPDEGKASVMQVRNKTVVWHAGNIDEIMAAEAAFAEYRAMGYALYRNEREGEAEVIRTFDPAAERILALPPLVGG